MSGRNLYAIIQRPVVSEKSYKLMDDGVYCFVVDPKATKVDVRYAVEQIFNVSVLSVNTLNRKGKRKRDRRSGTWSTGSAEKHAMVRLAPGDSIEIFEK
jgi:large subunit ribosomal protein L23